LVTIAFGKSECPNAAELRKIAKLFRRLRFMKILLVQQELGRRIIKYPLFPIGLTYIATALKDHEVKIFDPGVYDYPECFEELKSEVRNFRPDIAGLSIRNIDTTQRKDPFVYFKTVRTTIQTIKDIDANIKIIAGGTGFSIFAQQIMERVPSIDYGVYLEGDESAPELLRNLDMPEAVSGIYYRKNGQVSFTGPRPAPDFGKLPMPRRDSHLIDIKKYMGHLHNIIGVQSKRGCVYKCSYCGYPFLNKNAVRHRSPKDVVDEIEFLVTNYDLKTFTFVDSIFNIPEKHAIDICNEIIRRKLVVEWGAWCSMKNFSEKFMLLLKEAGCRHLGFSPDAVTDKGLSALCKGITSKDIDSTLNVARKVKGVAVGFNLFACYPGQDFRGFLRTIKLFFMIPILLPGRGGCDIGWIRLEPHTPLFNTALEEGFLDTRADMLAENEAELMKLFYNPPSQRYITVTMDLIIAVVEKVLKPAAKGFFRMIGRLRRKKSFYDS
jgi:anaerobic magnesium-protoporphyrin IX monomethyl ester cyclase